MDLINNIVSMYLLGIDNKNKYIEKHYNILLNQKQIIIFYGVENLEKHI